MKRLSLILLSLILLTSCASGTSSFQSANTIGTLVLENRDLFLSCAEEMSDLKEERIYVAMEEKEGEDLSEEEKKPRLVSYIKESDDREEFENALLEKVLTQFHFKLIFFQTSSDGRQSVIFSFAKENDDGVQNGFYYSADDLPHGFWGRKGDLVRRGERYLQIEKNGSGGYFTTRICDHFYYFEKSGNLTA